MKWGKKEDKLMKEFDEEIATGDFKKFTLSKSEKWDMQAKLNDGFWISEDSTKIYIQVNNRLKTFTLQNQN